MRLFPDVLDAPKTRVYGSFLQGSTVQPYFGSANLVNVTNKHLMPTHAQLPHPQLTHLSGLQHVGHELDRTTSGGGRISRA